MTGKLKTHLTSRDENTMNARAEVYFTNQSDKKAIQRSKWWHVEGWKVSSIGNKGGIRLPGYLVACLKSKVPSFFFAFSPVRGHSD